MTSISFVPGNKGVFTTSSGKSVSGVVTKVDGDGICIETDGGEDCLRAGDITGFSASNSVTCNGTMVEVTCKANGKKSIIPIEEFRKGGEYGNELTGYERFMLGRGIDKLDDGEYTYRAVANAVARNVTWLGGLRVGQRVKSKSSGVTGTIVDAHALFGNENSYTVKWDNGKTEMSPESDIVSANAVASDAEGEIACNTDYDFPQHMRKWKKAIIDELVGFNRVAGTIKQLAVCMFNICKGNDEIEAKWANSVKALAEKAERDSSVCLR